MIARIVVPLDGSETAELALNRAEMLCKEHKAPIHLVRVVDLTGTHGYSTFLAMERSGLPGALDAAETEAATYLDAVRRDLLERGCQSTVATPRGRAVQAIVNLVRTGDVVVMTTHGKGKGPRWFLGRVADEVQRRCRAPVEFVRVAPMPPPVMGALGHDPASGFGSL